MGLGGKGEGGSCALNHGLLGSWAESGQFPVEGGMSRAESMTFASSTENLEMTYGNCLVNATLEPSRQSVDYSYDDDDEEESLLRM